MRRKLFTILAAVSALSAVALGFAGVRSFILEDYWFYEGFTPAAGGGGHVHAVTVRLSRGGVRWDFQREPDLSAKQMQALHGMSMQSASMPGIEHQAAPPRELRLDHNSFGAWAGRLGWGFEQWSDLHGYSFPGAPPTRYTSFIFPIWFPTLLLAIWPGLRLRRWRIVRRRSKMGLCTTCGYDLRATPQRCPECGTVAAAPAAAAG